MRRFVSFGPALVVLLTVAAVLFAAPAIVKRVGYATTVAQVARARQALSGDDILERLNAAVRNIAVVVEPSVVHIEAYEDRGPRGASASGSGWVYDDAGHIVTNMHVIRGTDRLEVQFFDGRRVPGVEVVGADPYTDIAVLKVPVDVGVVPAQRATGEHPRQGERVFAFGSPFGFKFSMSQGIVSGLGRNPQTASEIDGFTNFIQTDAAVNPGNSGGPLVDIHGRVIGMNVAIATGHDTQGMSEGQSAGISFAIPLATIESVVDQLVDTGTVSRGYLGVQWNPFSERVEYQPAIRRTGVRIETLARGGPAERSGLLAGDLITAINGEPVTDYAVMRSVITSIRPGTTVTVVAFRDGELREVPVTLGEFPNETLAVDAARNTLIGFGVVFPRQGGAQVGRVFPETGAAAAGFKADQVVLEVAGKPVSNVSEMMLELVDRGLLVGKEVSITVSSDDGSSNGPRERIRVRVRR